MTEPFDWTQLDYDSLTPEQHEEFIASPMTQREIDLLEVLEKMMRKAFLEEAKAKLASGEALKELRDHPRMLWQRDKMFKTKSGKWKKNRSWDAYVKKHGLAENAKEANTLISEWELYQSHIDLYTSD